MCETDLDNSKKENTTQTKVKKAKSKTRKQDWINKGDLVVLIQ